MNPGNDDLLIFARELQNEISKTKKPPAEGYNSELELVIPFSVVKGSRGYIEKVTNQINGSYEKGWFDCCAVMIRRLLETLIIEVFEYHKLDSKIKDSDGNFFQLRDLITCTLSENSWNLTRNVKQSLPKLKEIGDLSAHSRRYNAHRGDLELLLKDIRNVTQELLSLASLK